MERKHKFSSIRDLLIREADIIQRLASQHHKEFLGGETFRDELLDKYMDIHTTIVKEIADNLITKDMKEGAEKFRELGRKLAKEFLKDDLRLEEAVDGTIFLKQAIWQKLKEKGLLDELDVKDFYEFSFTTGTYCDVLVSEISFIFHENYIKKLKEEGQHKDEFMSIATHELKTPVTSLKAFTQSLENRFTKAGDEESALYLAKMDAQLDRLTTLIGDLLDSTKIEAGKLQFNKEYFDVNELVGEVVEEMQRITEKQTILLKADMTRIIYGDRNRIEQVMVNLLSNAIKYSPHGNKIIVTTQSDKENVTICVQDFGIGIAKEHYDTIFQRFQRVGNQNTFGGLGLGLFIASTIVERHNGSIWVESEKNKGTTFCFQLPVAEKKIQ